MATTARGIVYPTVGTTLTPLANHFAALASSADTAIGAVPQNALIGLAAAIPTAGQEGRTYYATDTNRSWFDTGSTWISNDGGMYKIRPTSVGGTGVTIDSDGSINLGTAATNFVINGAFTSRFKTYKMVCDFRYTGGANAPVFQFSTAGAGNAGPIYFSQYHTGSGTGSTASQLNGGTSLAVVSALADEHTMEWLVLNPTDLSRYTKFQGHSSSITPMANLYFGGGTSVGTVFDGVTFILQNSSAGRFFNGGSVSIYGLA